MVWYDGFDIGLKRFLERFSGLSRLLPDSWILNDSRYKEGTEGAKNKILVEEMQNENRLSAMRVREREEWGKIYRRSVDAGRILRDAERDERLAAEGRAEESARLASSLEVKLGEAAEEVRLLKSGKQIVPMLRMLDEMGPNIVPAPAIYFDANGKRSYHNRALCELIGVNEADLARSDFSFPIEGVIKLLSASSCVEFEYKDKKHRMELNPIPIYDNERSLVGTVLLVEGVGTKLFGHFLSGRAEKARGRTVEFYRHLFGGAGYSAEPA